MPNDPVKAYWDACLFISYIEGTDSRIQTLDTLLEEASRSQSLEIWTSTFTITEVAFAESERADSELSDEVLDRMDSLWTGSLIRLVEFNAFVAREARAIVRDAMLRNQLQQQPTVKPADAVHLATASWIKATDFLTYDPKLLRQPDIFPFKIKEPFSPRLPLF